MSALEWTGGDADSSLQKQTHVALGDIIQRQIISACADYMHADGWARVIDWLNWEQIKCLVATGNKLMRRRIARFARHARVVIGSRGGEITDCAVMRLLHATPEGLLHLSSIDVRICCMSLNLTPDEIAFRTDRSIAVWNSIATRLRSVVKVSLRFDRYVISAAEGSECGIMIPPQATKVAVELDESEKDYSYQIVEYHNLTRVGVRECVVVGCGALTDIKIEKNPHAESLSLRTFRGLDPAKVSSLSAYPPPSTLDFLSPFVNLTELSLAAAPASELNMCVVPLSVTKLKLSDDHLARVGSFVNGMFWHLQPDNRITSLTIEYNRCSSLKQTTKDHLTALFRTVPRLESYRLLPGTGSSKDSRLCTDMGFLYDEINLADVANVLNNMVSLSHVPFELFDCSWSIWCAVYGKLTESRRRQLQLSFGNYHGINDREATGALQRWLKRSDDVQFTESLPDFPTSIHTIDFGHAISIRSTAPLHCLKSLPSLKTVSVLITDDSIAHPNVGHWIKQSLPPWLTTLSLSVSYADRVIDQQPFEDAGIYWLPPCLQVLNLTNVLPVKRMADVLPPFVTSLKMEGYWAIDRNSQVSYISGLMRFLNAPDFYKMGNGKWRTSLSLGLKFIGIEFDSFLTSFMSQIWESHDWYNTPSYLKSIHHDKQHGWQHSRILHTISCY